MKTTITREEYDRLLLLQTRGSWLLDELDRVDQQANDIVEEEVGGHISDVISGMRDLDEGLELIGVRLEEE